MPRTQPAALDAKLPAIPLAIPLANPLAGRRWGVYHGKRDDSWAPYVAATGRKKRLLGRVALRPKALWFTRSMTPDVVRKRVSEYIVKSQAGDPDTLVSMTIFGIEPWAGRTPCRSTLTSAQIASYQRWIDLIADEIADAHVLLVIQPDAPKVFCTPRPAVPLSMMRYASETFGALPHASVYIEVGAADWLRDKPTKALEILLPAGIEAARGFALNSTHYDSTRRQIRFSAKIAHALEKRGISGKRAVINTAANGRPFKGYKYQGPDFDNARTCKSAAQRRCVTLGIPPTADVANSKWGLKPKVRRLAQKYVDGYVWVGRPWLYRQADPFVMKRALRIARTTPFR
ncbi:MAG: glycoside hydrolase family 6 protein [Nocardioides sp.]